MHELQVNMFVYTYIAHANALPLQTVYISTAHPTASALQTQAEILEFAPFSFAHAFH